MASDALLRRPACQDELDELEAQPTPPTQRTWGVVVRTSVQLVDRFGRPYELHAGPYTMRELDETSYELQCEAGIAACLWYSEVCALIERGQMVVDRYWR